MISSIHQKIGLPALRSALCGLAIALVANACVGDIGDGGLSATTTNETTTAVVPQVMRIPNAVYRNAIVDVLRIEPSVVDAMMPPADSAVSGFTNHNKLSMNANNAAAFIELAENLAIQVMNDNVIVPEMEATCTAGQECLDVFLKSYGSRLFGRTLSAAEVKKLAALVVSLRETLANREGLERDIRLAITVLLQSPDFLFRFEIDNAENTSQPFVPRSASEVARALAQMLWASVPDQALLDAADAGSLDTKAGIEEVVQEMLSDPKSVRGIQDFVDSVVQASEFDGLSNAQTPLSEELRRTWREELHALTVDIVFDNNGTYADLLLAERAFINKHNAWVYGKESDSETLEKVDLDERYAGLLTFPAWMTLLSSKGQTNPIKRGGHIMKDFLCIDVAPIDLNPEQLDQVQEAKKNAKTVREGVESFTEPETCQHCHKTINPLGFAFEGLGAVGMPQTEFNGYPIDTVSTINFEELGERVIDGPQAVANLILDSKAGQSCFVRRVLTHARGYDPRGDDALRVEVQKIHDAPIKDIIALIASDIGVRRLDGERAAMPVCSNDG